MLDILSETLADYPGVLGYDALNEPHGDEENEISPLYEDAARVVRGNHPGAILFTSPKGSTSSGMEDTKLPRPTYDNIAYAPHYYEPTSFLGFWLGISSNAVINMMLKKAVEWESPLFLGEFGSRPTSNGLDYLDDLYRNLDATFSSAALWGYAAHWTEENKDGWNMEDFSIIDGEGNPRVQFRPRRPYARRISGTPVYQSIQYLSGGHLAGVEKMELSWEHLPKTGQTILFAPAALFSSGAEITIEGENLICGYRDEAKTILHCGSDKAGLMKITIQ